MFRLRDICRWFTAAVTLVVAAGGCTVIQTGDAITSAKLLSAANPSREAAPVDIYWAELDEELLDDDGLWRSIEETRLPTELRRRLATNGLRAGVVGGALPDSVLRLLNPSGGAETLTPEEQAVGVQPLESIGVTKATYTLTPGRRVDLQAGPSIDSAALLLPDDDGGLTGKAYDQAQPTYVLECERSSHAAGGVAIRLTPELRHGEQRLRFRPDDNGVISRASMTRDIELFDDLAIEASLAPGETLVVTSTPGADGRLGGYFHRASSDSPKRRAMLIRLAATPRDAAFDAETFDPDSL